jgi:hypothetical protein
MDMNEIYLKESAHNYWTQLSLKTTEQVTDWEGEAVCCYSSFPKVLGAELLFSQGTSVF